MDNDNLSQTQATPQNPIMNPAPAPTSAPAPVFAAPPAPAPTPTRKLPILTIALAIIAAATVGFAVFEAVQIADLKQKVEAQKTSRATTEASTQDFGNYRIETYKGKDYYIITGDYAGEYDLQIVDMNEKDTRTDLRSRMTHEGFNKEEVMTLDEYSEFCKTWGLDQKYTDAEKSYAVLSYAPLNVPKLEVRLAGMEIDGSTVKLYVWDSERDDYGDGMGYLLVVPVEPSAKTLEATGLITETEFKRITGANSRSYTNMRELINSARNDAAKPIIYLYPEQETKVSVALGNPELLTTVYPEYNNGWNVIARPDGSLTDLATNRNLYALYWEGKALEKPALNEGFVVAGKDSAKFLEEKLARLGLNEREAEEFIVYWLPKLESSPYNLIRFETKNEIEANMPLTVSPKPNTTIRVMMDFLPLETPINIPEQSLPETPERNGFTAVEWGGSDMSKSGKKLE